MRIGAERINVEIRVKHKMREVGYRRVKWYITKVPFDKYLLE